MKKRAFILLMLVFLAACAIQQEEREETSTAGGTEGLSLRFMPNTPPSTVYAPATGMPIMLFVENKGTYDVAANAQLSLSGFDTNIIKFKVMLDRSGYAENKIVENIPAVKGRGPFRPRGETNMREFTADFEDLTGFNTDEYNTIMLATACYKYGTKAQTEICVDFDPFSVSKQEKVCTPQDKILTGGQGAPLAVTMVEIEPAKDFAQLIIHLQNMGQGTIFKEDKVRDCSPYETGLTYSNTDIVNIKEIKVSDKSIKSACTPNSEVRLAGGEAIIYCKLNKTDLRDMTGAFVTPMSMEFEYGYRQSITQPITVKQSGGSQ